MNDPQKPATEPDLDLRDLLDRYERLLSATPDHISIVDRAYRYVMVNDSYLAAHGRRREQIIGRAIEDLLGKEIFETTVKPGIDRCLAGEVVSYEAWFEFAGKGRRAMNVTYSPYLGRAGGVEGVVVSARDVTEEKRLQVDLARAQRLEALGRLAGGVAHDFNNLLSVIMSYAEFAETHLARGESVAKDLKGISVATDRAAALTQQLLAVGRRQHRAPALVDVGKAVRGMESLLRRVVGGTLQVSLEISAEPCVAKLDPGQLEQLVLNLATNANDAMPGGGDLKIAVVLERDPPKEVPSGTYVLLSVNDTGHGMDPEVLEHIFDPFFTTKEVGSGSGLGLASSYGIVKQNHGYIDVHSEAGRGTRFELRFPLASGLALSESMPVSVSSPVGRETILVVDDDPDVRTVSARALRDHGYNVLEARGGSEALSIAKDLERPADLLLTDVAMPQLTGPELAVEVLAAGAAPKVLFMTGFGSGLRGGPSGVPADAAIIHKPFSPTQLAERVRRILDED